MSRKSMSGNGILDEKCGKGVTLTADEAKKLMDVLQTYFAEEHDNENNKEKNI